jgi:hypothetical protein
MELTRTVRDKMMNEHLMFVYRGVVTSENSVPLLMLLEKEMEHSEFGFVGRKRLFMFVLESLQNVSRHNRNSSHAHMSMVVYSKTESGYTVTTGNVLPNESISDLKRRLDEVNSLENKEIRNVYRQMLSSAEFSSKGGAGLGLIEMAKKTGNKLDYDFIPLNGEHSYFVLSKTVDAGGVGVHQPNEYVFRGESIMQLERIMAENSLYLIWSGHISPDVGKEVISFTETRLSEDDIALNLRKRVFSILVEILENVSKYSPGKEAEEKFGMPIAMLSFDEKVYSLYTGNLIPNSSVQELRAKLDDINRYDRIGLKEAFRKSLSGQSLDSVSTGNMGLLDMARKSGSKFHYDFEQISDIYSYYTLKVKVESRLPED